MLYALRCAPVRLVKAYWRKSCPKMLVKLTPHIFFITFDIPVISFAGNATEVLFHVTVMSLDTIDESSMVRSNFKEKEQKIFLFVFRHERLHSFF